MNRFAINVDALASEAFGLPCGRIAVGDWEETFALASLPERVRPEQSLEDVWRRELRRLVDGAPAVVLPVQPGRGWVLYRDLEVVHVQDQLFLVPDTEGDMILDGKTFAIRPRETVSEIGSPSSEWSTSMESIQLFLESTS